MKIDEDFKVSNGIMGTYKGIKIKRLISDQIYPFEVKGKYIVDEYKYDKTKISVNYGKGTKMKLFDTIYQAMMWISEQSI